MVNIQIEMLPVDERDAAMGKYMDAFSRMEGLLELMVRFLLKTDHTPARAVNAVLYSKQRIDLVEALASACLSEETAAKVARACERLSRRNMRRNHIVHGQWQQLVLVGDDSVEMMWLRAYSPSDPSLSKLPPDDPKLMGVYSFTIPELHRATDHVEEMLPVLSALLGEMREQLAPPPPPEESPDSETDAQ
jgi:hypothetical protein